MSKQMDSAEVDRVVCEERAAGHSVGWVLACPQCGMVGTPRMFEMSLASECFCPKCGAAFVFEPDGDEDED